LLSPLLWLLTWLLLAPFLFVRRLWRSLLRLYWQLQRQPWSRHLLRGLPAVFVALGVCIAVGAFRSYPADGLAHRYEARAIQAAKAGDFKTASVCYERLVQLNPGSARLRFALAVTLYRQGEHQRAQSIMQSLAPRDASGYGPAHLWLARQLLARADRLAANEYEAAEAHLKRAAQFEPVRTESLQLLSFLYLRTGRTRQAVQCLEEAARLMPELRVDLAKFYAAQGDGRRALEEAGRAAQWLRRRLSVDPGDHATRLRLAQALLLSGRLDEAAGLLREGLALYPTGPFALPLARLLQQWSRLPALSDQRRRLLLEEAASVLARQPQLGEQGKSLLAELYASLGEDNAAVRLWRALAAQNPNYHVRLAQFFAAKGDVARCRKEASRAIEQMRSRAAGNGRHPPFARAALAEAYRLNGQFAQAVATLKQGLAEARSDTERRRYRHALAKCYLAWWTAKQRGQQAQTAFNLIRQALEYDPWYPDAIARLVQLARTRGQIGRQAKSLLDNMLAKGDMPATVHFILGNDAWLRGDHEKARLHLSLAYKLDPGMTDAANNLAWALAHSDPPELKRALTLIEEALKRSPNNPSYRDTRGNILALMGKWEAALADLEFALRSHPGDPELHATLADVYDHLGMGRLADQHRQLARGEAQQIEAEERRPTRRTLSK